MQELRDELAAGKSIATIASEKGKSLDEVKAAMIADANARIDQAVADGRLSAEEGAAKKAEVAEKVDEVVQREGLPMRQQGLGPHAAYMQRLLDEGRLFAAGGFADDDGGMAIVRGGDMAEAQALIGADPAVISGIFVGAIEEWRPRFRVDGPLPEQN